MTKSVDWYRVDTKNAGAAKKFRSKLKLSGVHFIVQDHITTLVRINSTHSKKSLEDMRGEYRLRSIVGINEPGISYSARCGTSLLTHRSKDRHERRCKSCKRLIQMDVDAHGPESEPVETVNVFKEWSTGVAKKVFTKEEAQTKTQLVKVDFATDDLIKELRRDSQAAMDLAGKFEETANALEELHNLRIQFELLSADLVNRRSKLVELVSMNEGGRNGEAS